MAEESKVFDVAKPGTSKPDTGSKPMVIGHKYITSDPTLVNTAEETVAKPDKETAKIEPSHVVKKNVVKPPDEQPEKAETDKTVAEETEKKPAEDDAATEQTPEQKANEKQKAEDELLLQREEKLQELIKNKTYVLKIKDPRVGSIKMFFAVFIGATLVLLAALGMLIDAGIVDAGVNLPFDVIK